MREKAAWKPGAFRVTIRRTTVDVAEADWHDGDARGALRTDAHKEPLFGRSAHKEPPFGRVSFQ